MAWVSMMSERNGNSVGGRMSNTAKDWLSIPRRFSKTMHKKARKARQRCNELSELQQSCWTFLYHTVSWPSGSHGGSHQVEQGTSVNESVDRCTEWCWPGILHASQCFRQISNRARRLLNSTHHATEATRWGMQHYTEQDTTRKLLKHSTQCFSNLGHLLMNTFMVSHFLNVTQTSHIDWDQW